MSHQIHTKFISKLLRSGNVFLKEKKNMRNEIKFTVCAHEGEKTEGRNADDEDFHFRCVTKHGEKFILYKKDFYGKI